MTSQSDVETRRAGFAGLRVLSLESRRRDEIARLIANHGGQAMVAPSVREAPDAASTAVRRFAQELCAGQLDVAIFSTGVGTRALMQLAQATAPLEELLAALQRVQVIARSNKPAGALREFGIPITLLAPEPNTWQEIVQVLEQNRAQVPLAGRRVALQEHGAPSDELVAWLAERGANVLPVHVYQWLLPEDLAPLRQAIHALVNGEIAVVMLTSSVQLQHLLQVADEMQLRDQVLNALRRAVVASIGPVTSAELRKWTIDVDIEPTHPRMGFLVKEAAERSGEVLAQKQR